MPTITENRVAETIGLELACSDACAEFSFPLFTQLRDGDYSWPMSVLPLDGSQADYLAALRTGRKRASKARRLGYTVRLFDRLERVDEVFSINTSKAERQGRPMAESYCRRPEFSPLDLTCPRHRVNCYGAFDFDDTLVAYTFVYRAGDLALVSQILGHGDHPSDVMCLLVTEAAAAERQQGGFMVYNRWDSGTDGLQQFKRWCGFGPAEVTWAP